MRFHDIDDPSLVSTFERALFQGLSERGGLYMPSSWPRLEESAIAHLLTLPFAKRCEVLTALLLGDELGEEDASRVARAAFDFALPMVDVTPSISFLELFHGPSLAFKDFGARFMAQAMGTLRSRRGEKESQAVCILTATSGDTGAAVANAFHGVAGIRVVILFPRDGVSDLQRRQMTTLGENVLACAVDAPFDRCQDLVKAAFGDEALRERVGLTTANSMNVGRLLPQVFYYFEIAACHNDERPLVVAVPSGNFGNLTAGLLARKLGVPISRFVAATNANDTIPRLMKSGRLEPRPVVRTHSNAMDITVPNNWPRAEALIGDRGEDFFASRSIDDQRTVDTIRKLDRDHGYMADPHSAVGLAALEDELEQGEKGVVLATAHAAKFEGVMNGALGRDLELPARLASCLEAPDLAVELSPDFRALQSLLLEGLKN